MPEHVVVITRVFFWVLAAGVLFLPRKWSLFCWLLTAHFDLSGPQWQSATTIGWENVIRIIIFPSVLLTRVGIKDTFFSGLRLFPFRIWLLLCLYTVLSTFWSPFLLPALKQIGYLYAYSVGFLALLGAWERGMISARTISLYIYIVLGLAILQTFILGNPFGQKNYGVSRFTSFTAMQYFAESLVAIFSLVMFLPGITPSRKVVYSGLLLLQIILNGSRTGLLGTLAVLAVAFIIFLGPMSLKRVLISYEIVFISSMLILLFYLFPQPSLPIHKLRALDVIRVVTDDTDLTEIGTMGFRFGMWNATLYRVQKFSTLEYLFGRGTSSGAEVALQSFFKYDPKRLDANRVLHNEFLRVFYEWGIVGSMLFLAFSLSIIGSAVALVKRNNVGGFSLLGLIPMVLMTLGVENILAGSGGAGGIIFLLVFAFAASTGKSYMTMPFSGYKKKKRSLKSVYVTA